MRTNEFSELGIPEWLCETLHATFGFDKSLPVQASLLRRVANVFASQVNLDTCVSAPTGSGKTLCYVLPLLTWVDQQQQRFLDHQLRALILTPTHGQVQQVTQIVVCLGSPRGIVVCATPSGNDILTCRAKVDTKVDVLVGTPSDVEAWLRLSAQSDFSGVTDTSGNRLGHMGILVIDEADDALEGHLNAGSVHRISTMVHENVSPTGRVVHHFLCSATLTPRTVGIAAVRLRNSTFCSLDSAGRPFEDTGLLQPAAFHLPKSLREFIIPVCSVLDRPVIFLRLVQHLVKELMANTESLRQAILIFCNTPDAARVLGHFLQASCSLNSHQRPIRVLELTDCASDAERQTALLEAHTGSPVIVVATDSVLRGIDLPGVAVVVQYELAERAVQYVHRVGRTARGGNEGESYVLVGRPTEKKRLKSFENIIHRENELQSLPSKNQFTAALSDMERRRVEKHLAKAQAALTKDWSSANETQYNFH